MASSGGWGVLLSRPSAVSEAPTSTVLGVSVRLAMGIGGRVGATVTGKRYSKWPQVPCADRQTPAAPAAPGVQSTHPVVASMRNPAGGASHSDQAMGPVPRLTLAAPLALYRYGTPTAAFGLASSTMAG